MDLPHNLLAIWPILHSHCRHLSFYSYNRSIGKTDQGLTGLFSPCISSTFLAMILERFLRERNKLNKALRIHHHISCILINAGPSVSICYHFQHSESFYNLFKPLR